jgi:hypothetical protein
MQKLSSAKLLRAGRTARSWNFESNDVKVGTVEAGIRLNFNLSSKGGGITQVQLEVGAQDFAALVFAMVSADRGAAMRVIADALAGEIAKQPEHDRMAVQRGRESVGEAADRAYRQAPTGKDHAERLTSDMVGQLIAELNKADETASGAETKAA